MTEKLSDSLTTQATPSPASFVGRLRHRLVKGRDTQIASGLARGLWINVGKSNSEYAAGTNELAVQEVLASYLKPGNVLYDIGANIGFFTLLGARLAGPNGQVHAFEPLPVNAALVRHNCTRNGFTNVILWEQAVSDVSGRGELYVAKCSGGSGLTTVSPPPDLQDTLAIETITIDDLLAQQRIAPPDVIKLDVEGAELLALRGMRGALEKYKPVIVYELDDGDPLELERKRTECATFLHLVGYNISALPNAYFDNWYVEHFVAIPQVRQPGEVP